MRVDRVDEADRELEDGEENAHLRAGRIAKIADLHLLAVAPGPAAVGEEDDAQRIVDLDDVFAVEDSLLVAAGDDGLAGQRLGRAERAVLEAAHRVLAARSEERRVGKECRARW